MKYDNPAGRLLEVLTRVRQFEKTTQAREVWTTVFDLPVNDLTPLLTATLGKAMLLPYEAVSMLAEEHPELAVPPPTWVLQVSAAFQAHNVHSTIESFSQHMSDETLVNVRTTAVLLDKGSKRRILSSNELSDMREQINAVLTEVLESEIEDSLRTYVARALRKILIAIDEYKLGGALPILESVEQAVGHAMVDPTYKSFLTDAELGKRVFDALQAAGGIVTVAAGMPLLMQAAQHFLK